MREMVEIRHYDKDMRKIVEIWHYDKDMNLINRTYALKNELEEMRKKRPEESVDYSKSKLQERKVEDKAKRETAPHVAMILHELAHCKVNHPDSAWPWKSFDFIHQVAVMMEEAGEALRAANNMREGKGGTMELYNELAQTAAMCIRCMEQVKEYSDRAKDSD